MATEIVRPACVLDEHLLYLDALRESGACNMFGAAEYVASEYHLDRFTAKRVLVYWMETYAERHPRP